MTTAIIGVGNLGSALARRLVGGDEPIVLAAKDDSHAEAVSQEIGPLARAASVEYAIVTARIPADAHYVSAFGTLSADALASAANREPRRAVLFYATDDDIAAGTVERLSRPARLRPGQGGRRRRRPSDRDARRRSPPDGPERRAPRSRSGSRVLATTEVTA